MVQTVYLNDMESVQRLLFEQKRNNENGRLRSSYFYRGMPNKDFSLIPSLFRNCGDFAETLEKPILENFIKYVRIEDPFINESIWKAMIIGQHHGLPTRLLDWTHSTLVALHFANTESNLSDLDAHDCAVWRIDAREINTKLPQKYKEKLNEKKTFIFSVESLTQLTDTVDQYDVDMQGNALVMLEPPSIDQRIVNQYSFFSVIPQSITDLEGFLDRNTKNTVKYVINKELRWDLRDILDQLNMNERMIYPGKDGIAKWLARHYYVKSRD